MENQIEKIQEVALTWPERAKSLIIINQETYSAAARVLLEIAEIEKRIREHHEPIKTAAHNAHKAAVTAEKKFLDPLMQAKNIIKNSISTWEVEQSRIRAEAERKAIEEATKKEEEERLAKAIEAEKAGKTTAEVEKIIETPTPIKVAPIKPTFERDSRVSTRETWRAEVVDLRLLCQAIVDGKAPLESIDANIPALNILVRATKENFAVPGVRAIKETNVVMR